MTELKTFRQYDTVLCVAQETLLQRAKGVGCVRAEACGECGYVQYFLEKPHEVYEEWRKYNA
ncbi:MAG: hypothetical protein H8F28_20995 [Fibrella sp.]|nr:hypothetical protein [Armatimonadota bacterium]